MSETTPNKKGGWHRLLYTLLIVPVFWYGSGFLARAVQPWRFADEPGCVKYEDGSYANVCEFAVMARWCVRPEDPDPERAACHLAELQPGELDRQWRELLVGMERSDQLWRYACKAPYLPARIPNVNKPQQIIDGCRRPRDESSG